MSVTIVIPARGGSVTVNRKALQLLDGTPLVMHAVALAGLIAGARVVVTTEDREIASLCRLRNVEVLDRPLELSHGDVPLAEVLQHAAQNLPGETFVLLQPTVPLLRWRNLELAIEEFQRARAAGVEAAYLVAPDPHQYWQGGRRITPFVNRQRLEFDPKVLYKETGIRICSRSYALTGVGAAGVIELDPGVENLDIDTYEDLNLAEAYLRRKLIVLKCVVSKEYGTGHLFRCLRIAEHLRRNHDVVVRPIVVWDEWARRLLESRGLSSLPKEREGQAPDLVIFDTLDLADDNLLGCIGDGIPVIALETESAVAHKHAQAIINELAPPAAMSGPRFAVLREEFLGLPWKTLSERVQRILVTFGGSDPARLADRVMRVRLMGKPHEVRVVQGPAAEPVSNVPTWATAVSGANMAEEMVNADLIITSKGRTQYEAAVCGTPTITIAANEREARHYGCPGQVHLGLHATVSDAMIYDTVQNVARDWNLRKEMALTAASQVDGLGVERISWLVEGILRGL